MIVITGAAGFIGSCLLRSLNEIGIEDIVCVDYYGANHQCRNIYGCKFEDILDANSIEDVEKINKPVDVIIHLGACSSTCEGDMAYVMKHNYIYSKRVFELCYKWNCRLIYMSSASVYGKGLNGFSELAICSPQSGYAFSKSVFDQWQVCQNRKLRQCVGLRLFNVYGPNEWHKGSMASLVTQFYEAIMTRRPIIIYGDGTQCRDFVYVYDVIQVILFFLEHYELNGIYNVGTGEAVSFFKVAQIIKNIVNGCEIEIEYRSLPKELESQYQFYTCADISRLREVGYCKPFRTVETGIAEYISLCG